MPELTFVYGLFLLLLFALCAEKSLSIAAKAAFAFATLLLGPHPLNLSPSTST